MVQLIKRKPEDQVQRENVFQGIYHEPWWRKGLEAVAYAAALVTLAESIIRLWPG